MNPRSIIKSRAEKNKVSKEIGACMAHGEKEKAEELKKKVQENAARMEELSAEEKEVEAKIKKDMMDPKYHRSICTDR